MTKVNFQYILEHELTIPQHLNENEPFVHVEKGKFVSDFSDRLEQALSAAGINRRGAGALLSRLTGVTPKAAAKWINGESEPRKEKLEAIADRCHVRAEWLEYGVGPMSAGGNLEATPNYRSRKRAPVISWVQAGCWTECSDPLPPGEGESWLEVPDGTSDHAFWLRVVGDSMTSLSGTSVPEGSLILVSPDVEATNGRLVIAKLTDSDEVTFKRLIQDGGKTYLKPLNPSYPVIEITENCRIVGVVVEARQKL
ncbi:MAG: LexA family protein [Marinobacter sp.]